MSKVKKVFKAVKKVVSSPVGQIALAGLSIYGAGAALGAWGGAAASGAAGAGAAAAGGTAASTTAAAGVAAKAASTGGFWSTLGTAGKVASAVSGVASLGGVLGVKPEEYSQTLSAQGGTAASTDNLSEEAAAAAAEEEKKRQRRGAGQNIATSPLGLVTPGSNAASVLLG